MRFLEQQLGQILEALSIRWGPLVCFLILYWMFYMIQTWIDHVMLSWNSPLVTMFLQLFSMQLGYRNFNIPTS
ncbi:hypothetical protein CCR75_002324 [Bremia lactucae]|uniref:Uncharacterized protein n=1 Tax=Bremia lactucae TaxID=4779 RepID=A0A976IKR7_BRELC|nr:hypothetical protein CCR75_002324 [Bremia lactucae]